MSLCVFQIFIGVLIEILLFHKTNERFIEKINLITYDDFIFILDFFQIVKNNK